MLILKPLKFTQKRIVRLVIYFRRVKNIVEMIVPFYLRA